MKFVRFLGICTALLLSLAFMVGAKAETTPDYNAVYDGTVWNSNQANCKIGICYNYTGSQTGNTTFNNTKPAAPFNFTRGQSLTVGTWVYLNKIQGATEISPVFAEGGVTFGVVGQKAVITYIDSGASNYGHNTSAQLSANTWYYIVYNIKFGSTGSAQIYVNGVNQTTSMPCGAGAATSRNNTEDYHVGGVSTAVCGGVYTTVALNASVDELGVWNKTLNQSDINSIYQGGSGVTNPFSNASNSLTSTLLGGWFIDTVNILRIGAADAYNSTIITSFNATVNGTYMATTNGSIVTNISTNSSSLINFTVSASSYFTNTTNINYNITTNPTVYLVPYTAIRVFNLTLSQLSNFTVNYTNIANSSDTGSVSTTTGIGFIPLYNGIYEVLVYNVNTAGTNYTSMSANLTANPYLSSYNFTSYYTNTFNISVRNETTNIALANNTVVYFQFIGENVSYEYNVTVNSSTGNLNTGNLTISLLVPQEYKIVYWYDSDIKREYYTTLTNQSFSNLVLYTIDESVSQYYLPVVTDTSGITCADELVNLLRFYIDINGYRTVQMAKTDTLGQAVLRVEPNTIPYKMIFSGDCGNFTSQPQKFVSTTDTYAVTDAQSVMTEIQGVQGLTKSFVFNNATGTFVFTWDATAYNFVYQACLYVNQWQTASYAQVYGVCNVSTSGSSIYTVNDTQNSSYIATATLIDTSGLTVYSDSISYNYSTDYETFGLTGVFLTLLVLLAFVFLAGGSTEATVFGGLFAIFLMGTFGFIYHSYVGFVGMVIVGVIIAYKSRT